MRSHLYFRRITTKRRKIKRGENGRREKSNPILRNCELIKYRIYHIRRRWVNAVGLKA